MKQWLRKPLAVKNRPAPAETPPGPEALNPENLNRVFADCADFRLRRIRLGGAAGSLSAALCCLEGMVSAEAVSGEVLRPLTEEERFGGVTGAAEAADKLCEGLAWCYASQRRETLAEVTEDLLFGCCAVVFDGVAVTFETKQPRSRGVEKSETEKSVKGAKDAFTEVYRLNTALLRQRIRTADLKLTELTVGRRTRTRVGVAYIRGLTNSAVVEELVQRLSEIDVDGALTAGSLEEYLLPRLSPFPRLTVTEKPDRFALDLLEGRAGLLADGLPLGFLMQGTLAEQLKVTEDRTGHPLIASALTLLRYAALFLSLLLPALYVTVTVYHPEMLPDKLLLSVIRSKQDVPFSTAAETLGMLAAFELLQEAGLRLPQSVGETVSIIGALIVGQSAVEARVISPIVVIVVAVAGITGFTTPNQDLAAALRLCRFALVLLGLVLGLYGLVFGMALLIYYLCTLESFGTAYLSPFCDGDPAQLARALLRLPLKRMKERPAALRPEDVRNQK
jgi:hypothetical protein